MNTWETLTFIPHASQASQASQGRGVKREKIFPNIYRSSQTLWCLVPGTPGVAPEQIDHCEHPQFLFRRQRVLSDHLTPLQVSICLRIPRKGELKTGYSHLNICFLCSNKYMSVFSHHYTLMQKFPLQYNIFSFKVKCYYRFCFFTVHFIY